MHFNFRNPFSDKLSRLQEPLKLEDASAAVSLLPHWEAVLADPDASAEEKAAAAESLAAAVAAAAEREQATAAEGAGLVFTVRKQGNDNPDYSTVRPLMALSTNTLEKHTESVPGSISTL